MMSARRFVAVYDRMLQQRTSALVLEKERNDWFGLHHREGFVAAYAPPQPHMWYPAFGIRLSERRSNRRHVVNERVIR
jgi:hypothetical protein